MERALCSAVRTDGVIIERVAHDLSILAAELGGAQLLSPAYDDDYTTPNSSGLLIERSALEMGFSARANKEFVGSLVTPFTL